MALITLPPKFGFSKISKWGLVRAGNTIRSRFTGSRQTITYPYALWAFEGDLIEYPEPEASAIRAFLASLEGQENTFQLPVPGWQAGNAEIAAGLPYTSAFAAPVRTNVTTVLANGAGPGATVMSPGDYFVINGDELKIATKVTDGASYNNKTVEFQPPLRKTVVVNSAIVVRNPYCVMSAIEDDVATWGLAPPVKHGFSLKALEAF
jgi:hypothetical protein